MLINPNHSNTVSFPITDANNMSISMSFDPTHPPPIYFQQPLPSSLSVPPPPVPQRHHQMNYNDNHRMLHQVTHHFKKNQKLELFFLAD
jgi:hypothetical protein